MNTYGTISKIKVIELHGQYLLGRTYDDRGISRVCPKLESFYFRTKPEAAKLLATIHDNTEIHNVLLPDIERRHLPKLGG